MNGGNKSYCRSIFIYNFRPTMLPLQGLVYMQLVSGKIN
jgi:hypothetical protein